MRTVQDTLLWIEYRENKGREPCDEELWKDNEDIVDTLSRKINNEK